MSINNRTVSSVYKVLFLAAVLYGLVISISSLLSLRMFTIQSNILVVAAILYLLLAPDDSRARPVIRGSVMLMILVTGLVYHLLLVPQDATGGISLSGHLTHTVAPIGFLLDWLLFDRKGRLQPGHLLYWIAYPVLYWIVIVIQGAFTGFYPYFFMDVSRLGYGAAVLWLVALLVVFSVIGLILMGADRLMGRRPVESRVES